MEVATDFAIRPIILYHIIHNLSKEIHPSKKIGVFLYVVTIGLGWLSKITLTIITMPLLCSFT